MKAWSILAPEDFLNGPLQQAADGRWRPAKPYRYISRWNDLKLAWLVLTHKAEAVSWEDD